MDIDWYNAFLLGVFALSVIFYRYIKLFKLGAITWLMLLICVTELVCHNSELFGWSGNQFVYNYYILYSVLINFYVFYRMLDYKRKAKRIYIISASCCMGILIYNWLFVQGYWIFNTYSVILIEVIGVVLSVLVIAKLFIDDEDISVGLADNPYFWLSGGTLIFGFGSMVVLGLQQFIQIKDIQINGKHIYRIIMPILSVLLYASYCYSFILCRKLTNRLSPSSLS